MVSLNQKNKAEQFLKLHEDKDILVLLNSWDPGSSRLIEACGFKAIATTSMGILGSTYRAMDQALKRVITTPQVAAAESKPIKFCT